MLLETKGIVLTRIKYGDSGIISSIYTKELGLSSFLIQGVRSKKSKIKAVSFNPLAQVNLITYHKETRTLHRLKEISINEGQDQLLFDPRITSIAQFLAEVFKKTIPENEPDSQLFEFISLTASLLENLESGFKSFTPWVLWKYCRFLGILPSNHISGSTPYFNLKEGEFMKEQMHLCLNKADSALIEKATNSPSHTSLKFKGNDFLENTLTFYRHQLEGFEIPKSLEVLRAVFT